MSDALLKSVEQLEDAAQALLLLPLEVEPLALQQQAACLQKLAMMSQAWRLCFCYK